MKNKKKFTVEITETLQRHVEVTANSAEEAEDIVREMYRNEEIVLDASDYIDTEFQVIEKEDPVDLPKEITISLDDLSLDDFDDIEKVVDAISEYLSDTYGYCHRGFDWERGDDVDTIDIYDIVWDTTGVEEYDEDDRNYLIVEEDGTKHYYENKPDVDIIHGFVVGMCVDITIYEKTEDGEWEKIDSYHA